MAFFGDFGKKVSQAAQAAAKKSGELVEITKLNANISSQEDSIKKCYIKMGQMCFEMYKENNLGSQDLQEVCKEIVAYQDKIEELREQIAKVKEEGKDDPTVTQSISEQQEVVASTEDTITLNKEE